MFNWNLDPVIHAPNRLRICAFLSPLEEAEFRALREELDVSESVLSKHLSQLIDAGYIEIRKAAVGGRQRRWARLTQSGRIAFSSHIATLKSIADSADTQGARPGDSTRA